MSTDFLALCPLEKALALSPQCYSLVISKVLSTGILAGAVALKLPQILNIVSSKDVRGLSPTAFYTEVPISITSVLYCVRLRYPFLSYGENVMILAQNTVLVLLLWKYLSPSPSLTSKASVLALFAAVTLLCYVLPEEHLYLLPLLNLPLALYARLAQIVANVSQGSTGQLSSVTTLLTFLGSLARIFTTLQDVGNDVSLLAGFGLGAALSGILLLQIVYYEYLGGKTKTSAEQTKAKKID